MRLNSELLTKLAYSGSIVLWLLYVVIAASWRPSGIPDLNPIRRLTGYQCPLTGLTRSIYYAAHGEWRTAFELNPMFPAYVSIVFYCSVIFFLLTTGRISRVDPKPILLAVAVTMTLTIVIRLAAGLPMRV